MQRTLTETLDKMEVTLREALTKSEAETERLKAELDKVLRAKSAIQPPAETVEDDPDPPDVDPPSPFEFMTIKELVVKALEEYFPEGATANEMIEFFRLHWNVEVSRPSLSPQLSRLKDDAIISRDKKTWRLVEQEQQHELL